MRGVFCLRFFKGEFAKIPLFRGQKINANFFCTKFFENPSGHGRPRRKSWTSAPKTVFFCGPGDGEKLFDPGASKRRVRNVRGKSGPKSLCLCCFFFPDSFVKITDFCEFSHSFLQEKPPNVEGKVVRSRVPAIFWFSLPGWVLIFSRDWRSGFLSGAGGIASLDLFPKVRKNTPKLR